MSFAGLTERWENLSHKAEEAQRASVLQRELAAMHLEFRGAYERFISHEVLLEPDQVLDERINLITVSLYIFCLCVEEINIQLSILERLCLVLIREETFDLSAFEYSVKLLQTLNKE